ncbi:MAG: lipooligosaccharide sialyltransferase [Lachnospiraceae bacterium]
MKERIYVCHTYYHVYVTLLKEFALPKEKQGKATMVLSKMSTDFENLKGRLENIKVFEEVIEFDEKRHTFFPELEELRKDRGNIVKNMLARMKYTKLYAKLEEPYIPVDFKQYKDIYVFCDSDPIGYYLNYKHIKYHAMEDGYNCLKIFDAARYDNRGCFKLKAFMASLNLIFIQNGYSKYCIDMEVNDRSCLKYDYRKYVEVPRAGLEERLTAEEKELIVRAFMENAEQLIRELANRSEKNAIVLTEELCDEDVRKQMFADLIAEYCEGYKVFIKPHPKDLLDYEKVFPQHIVLKGRYPLEVMKYIPGVHFHRAVAIFTQAMENMDFVEEKLYLGADFMERYQEAGKYRYNEKI